MVLGWLPKEKILIFADTFNPTAPRGNPRTKMLVDNIERLGLQPDYLLSVHALNPDRMMTLQELKATLAP